MSSSKLRRAQPAQPLSLLDLTADMIELCMPTSSLRDVLAASASCKTLKHVCRQPSVIARIELPRFVGSRMGHKTHLAQFAEAGNPAACLRLGLALVYGTVIQEDQGLYFLRVAEKAGGEVGAAAAFEIFLRSPGNPAQPDVSGLKDAASAGHLGAKAACGMIRGMKALRAEFTPPIPAGPIPMDRLHSTEALAAWDTVAAWRDVMRANAAEWLGSPKEFDRDGPEWQQFVRSAFMKCEAPHCQRWRLRRFKSDQSKAESYVKNMCEIFHVSELLETPHALQFAKCAGCMTVRYCSMLCHMVHWVNGHKRECTPHDLQ